MVNAAEMRMGLGGMSPRHPGVAPTVLSMLQSARRGLAEAADESAPGARYVTAHLAALRAAAAVVAARGEPRSRRRKPHSVWELLPQVEPALTEWAAFFAAGARKRASAIRMPWPCATATAFWRKTSIPRPGRCGAISPRPIPWPG